MKNFADGTMVLLVINVSINHAYVGPKVTTFILVSISQFVFVQYLAANGNFIQSIPYLILRRREKTTEKLNDARMHLQSIMFKIWSTHYGINLYFINHRIILFNTKLVQNVILLPF